MLTKIARGDAKMSRANGAKAACLAHFLLLSSKMRPRSKRKISKEVDETKVDK